MIAVRIPEEIRKYKEKLAFGLTARQLICTIITGAICVPLYWNGKDIIPEDILGWAIIIIALPLLSIGYVKFNGVPMERMAKIIFLTQVLYPVKRKFKSENAFRTWQEMADAEERPKLLRDRRKLAKYKKELALEKTFLLAEAEASGEATYTSDVDKEAAPYDVDKEKILTVRNPFDNKKNNLNNEVTVKSNLDSNTIGTYTITYSLHDITKIRTVKVVAKPDIITVIHLNGEKNIYLNVGETFNEPGYSAIDAIDGDLTDKVKVSGSFDTSNIGTYRIIYSVVNSSGVTTSETRTIIVQ